MESGYGLLVCSGGPMAVAFVVALTTARKPGALKGGEDARGVIVADHRV